MSTIRLKFAWLIRLLVLAALLPVVACCQAVDDARAQQEEIAKTLKEITDHAKAFRQSPASVKASAELEFDLARLQSLLERMDLILKSLPCGASAPDGLDMQTAFEAMRPDASEERRATLEKQI